MGSVTRSDLVAASWPWERPGSNRYPDPGSRILQPGVGERECVSVCVCVCERERERDRERQRVCKPNPGPGRSVLVLGAPRLQQVPGSWIPWESRGRPASNRHPQPGSRIQQPGSKVDGRSILALGLMVATINPKILIRVDGRSVLALGAPRCQQVPGSRILDPGSLDALSLRPDVNSSMKILSLPE